MKKNVLVSTRLGTKQSEMIRKKNLWLELEWVTPSGSHFQCQNPDLKSTEQDTKKKILRSTQPDILRKNS